MLLAPLSSVYLFFGQDTKSISPGACCYPARCLLYSILLKQCLCENISENLSSMSSRDNNVHSTFIGERKKHAFLAHRRAFFRINEKQQRCTYGLYGRHDNTTFTVISRHNNADPSTSV